MSVVSLLDWEGEVRLAKRMEQGTRKVTKALSRAPWLWKKLMSLDEQLEKNQLGVSSLIDLETGQFAMWAKRAG